MYSWVEYSKARAAVKLLAEGLPRRRLRPSLERLDAEVEGWWKLPLLAYQSHVIVPKGEGIGYTILDGRQGAYSSFIAEADPSRMREDLSELEHAVAVATEMRDEGPLGTLHRFDEAITMDPVICAGNPIVKGTRLETAFLAALHRKGFQTAAEIAGRFNVDVALVRSAVDFEQALAA